MRLGSQPRAATADLERLRLNASRDTVGDANVALQGMENRPISRPRHRFLSIRFARLRLTGGGVRNIASWGVGPTTTQGSIDGWDGRNRDMVWHECVYSPLCYKRSRVFEFWSEGEEHVQALECHRPLSGCYANAVIAPGLSNAHAWK